MDRRSANGSRVSCSSPSASVSEMSMGRPSAGACVSDIPCEVGCAFVWCVSLPSSFQRVHFRNEVDISYRGKTTVRINWTLTVGLQPKTASASGNLARARSSASACMRVLARAIDECFTAASRMNAQSTSQPLWGSAHDLCIVQPQIQPLFAS